MEKTDNAPVIKFNGNIITELEAVKKYRKARLLIGFQSNTEIVKEIL